MHWLLSYELVLCRYSDSLFYCQTYIIMCLCSCRWPWHFYYWFGQKISTLFLRLLGIIVPRLWNAFGCEVKISPRLQKTGANAPPPSLNMRLPVKTLAQVIIRTLLVCVLYKNITIFSVLLPNFFLTGDRYE